jgi:hypothetical protein
VASIERTAYPRFKRVVSARELHESFTPLLDEIGWARERTRSQQHLDLTTCVNGLVAEGWLIDREDLATISPYLASKLRRFGDWNLDLTPPPAAVLDRFNLPDPPPVR